MKLVLSLLVIGSLFSCSTKTCKPNENLEQTQSSAAQKNLPVAGETKFSPTTTMTNQNKKLKIYKPDGSVQCEPGSGISATEMAKQLGDVKVYSAETKHDGLIRIQVCGQATGNSNVFEINESDYAKAEKLGFKKWKSN